jgi:hypothetical protein
LLPELRLITSGYQALRTPIQVAAKMPFRFARLPKNIFFGFSEGIFEHLSKKWQTFAVSYGNWQDARTGCDFPKIGGNQKPSKAPSTLPFSAIFVAPSLRPLRVESLSFLPQRTPRIRKCR